MAPGSSGVKAPACRPGGPGYGPRVSTAGPQPGTPQAKPPPRSFPEGVPRQGPAAADPSEKRGRVERRSPTSDPSGAPRNTGSSGRKLRAARAGRPAGRMTKFGRAPRRRLPFMAHSPAADVAAWAPRPRGCGHGWEGAAGGGGGGSASRTSPEGRPSSGPLPSSPSPAGQARPPHSPRGKLRPGRVASRRGHLAPRRGGSR